MLLNLGSKYAECVSLIDAISQYSESEILQAFSKIELYMSAVKKYEAENNVHELTVLKSEFDKTIKLISEETSNNLKLIKENEIKLDKSSGNLQMYYFCEIYPLQINIAYDSIHQAVLMRESLRLQKMIDHLNNCDNNQEYERISSEIDLLESEAASCKLQGKLNELRYKTDSFQTRDSVPFFLR